MNLLTFIDQPLLLDAISAANPRVIDDSRARKLSNDLKRSTYYETCSTYGLNVERVFQDGEAELLPSVCDFSRDAPHTHTRTRTCARAHAHAHTHTRTRTLTRTHTHQTSVFLSGRTPPSWDTVLGARFRH